MLQCIAVESECISIIQIAPEHALKRMGGIDGVHPLILYFGNSFTSQLRYRKGKRSVSGSNRKLCVRLVCYGRFRDEKSVAYSGN
jgi:hypothetical protein